MKKSPKHQIANEKSDIKIGPKKKQNVALSSVMASIALTLMKFFVGIATGSIGVISEAAHSALDFGAALLTYISVKIADKPADETHQYGHSKVESISALIETGLLFITCVWIVYEAIHRLFFKEVEVLATWYAFVVIIISIVIDFSRSKALNKVAIETKSQALEADALHFSSDIWSSVVVLIGLTLVAMGIKGADAVAAIGVSIFVFIAGFKLGKRTIDVLIDAAPAGITETVKEIVAKVEGVVSIERIRVRPAGPSMFIDMVIKISRKVPLTKAQEITKAVEDEVIKKIHGADIVVHTKPVQLTNETVTDSVQILAAKQGLSVHDIVFDKIDNRKHISYDLELPHNITIEQAHEHATKLERAIQNEMGTDIELNTHLEPAKSEAVLSSKIPKAEIEYIGKIVRDVAKKIELIHNIHTIIIRKIDNKMFITLHCQVDKKTPLEIAHSASAKLEYLIRERLPKVKRAVVHVEPE